MNTKIIKFDLNKKLYEKIVAKQGDTKSRFLLFNLLDGSVPFDLTNRFVRVYGLKRDGTEIFNDLIINNASKGYCTLELTNQMLALDGYVELELMILEGDKKLTSNTFTLEVRKSINSEKAIVSTNEFTTLLNGLASLNEYDKYKNEIKDARGGQVELKDRLDNFDSHLDTKAEKVYVDTKIGNIGNSKTFKGSCLLSALPTSTNENGDYWYVTDKATNYCWNSTSWIDIGNNINIGDNTITDSKINKNSSIVIKKPIKNLYNFNTVTEGFYVNNANGNLVKLDGYGASDFIEIDSNTIYTLSLQFDSTPRAIEQVAFYDENKIYISGLTMAGVTGSAKITTPINAKYIRLSIKISYFKYYQLELGENKTNLEQYKVEMKESDLPTSVTKKLLSIPKINIINVKQDGTGDFVSLRLALESIIDANSNNLYQVNIYEGTYDIMSYYTQQEIDSTNFIGLIKKDYISLVGIGDKDKIILKGELTSTYSTETMNRVSTLVAYGTGDLINLIVTAKNLRYAVHDDYNFPNLKRNVKNCRFIKYKGGGYVQAYGEGSWSGTEHIFEDCYFYTETSGFPYSFHNNTNLAKPSKHKLINCAFENEAGLTAIRFGSLGSGQKDEIELIGCKIKGQIKVFEEQSNGVGIDFKLSGYGNDIVPVEIVSSKIGEQWAYEFTGETKKMYAGGTITKGMPLRLNSSGSAVSPLSTANVSLFYGIAMENIGNGKSGMIRIGGYLPLNNTNLTGLTLGDKIGVVNGELAKVTTGDYIGVYIINNFIKLI